jgi:hypothetical protein
VRGGVRAANTTTRLVAPRAEPRALASGRYDVLRRLAHSLTVVVLIGGPQSSLSC